MAKLTLDPRFHKGLEKLGFAADDALFLVNAKSFPDPQVAFHIEKAKEFQAAAVYLRKQLNGSYKPQAYLYDYTGKIFEENELTEIQKKVWSSGEAPIVCVFYDTEIKIIDCSTHINDDNTPVYLVKSLQLAGAAHKLYNEQFAIKIKSGIFWEEEENRNKFKFNNSSYDKLIDNVRYVVESLKAKYSKTPTAFINKIIIQSILIKYLEERIDDDGNRLLSDKYFKKYDKALTFNDVLRRKGKFVDLINDLNDPKKGFNGNIFEWTAAEKEKLREFDLKLLSDLLDNSKDMRTGQAELWRYFEFKFIPVELISRLYEEFLGQDKKGKGLYYTPAHLAKLLVDEAIPLKKFNDIDLNTYRILDPACGSGIFLVIAFKRLVQIWRLQNDMALPELSDLKRLLRNIYGIDKEEQAVRLASFSLCLALCNELNPIDIINKLKFDDLRQTNILHSDFFDCAKLNDKKFDLIIGNPPFIVGSLNAYSPYWVYDQEKVKIPGGQLALKFLSESLSYLKEKGLQCLIIKSSGLLYNDTSKAFKKLLFSRLNVIQILDFTALGRNKSLWDNADVGSAAIFVRNELPDFTKNILHLTFRRTKATKERIIFEIDDYDLHFISRIAAIEQKSVWKNNLVGGGRVNTVLAKHSYKPFERFLSENNCVVSEGFKIGSKGKKTPNFIYKMKTLPTEAIHEDYIDYEQLSPMPLEVKFEKVPPVDVFTAPNLVIWENIGENRIPVHLNEQSFSFQHKLIGISNKKNNRLLKKIAKSFDDYNDFYRFFIYATSGQVLVNLNTAILKTDIMNIPFIDSENDIEFSEIDKNVISDVNSFMQDFLRHGEGSEALKPVNDEFFKDFLSKYGTEFSRALNNIYKKEKKAYRLTDVITIDRAFLATVFRYDHSKAQPKFHNSVNDVDIPALSTHEVSKQLSVNRIIKLYPEKDTIVFVKPNQYRYWISLAAYRDADKCFSDLIKMGY